VRTLLSRCLAPGSKDPAPVLRPSRGIHLVYPRLTAEHGLLLFARQDGRVFFVVPFGDRSLVGTTEAEVESPPPERAFRPTVEEIRYLRAELRRVLPGHAGLPPLAVFAGLRPLLASEDDVGSASREHRVFEEHGVLTVAGGKYTTFRVIARDVLRRVQRRLGLEGRRLADPADPLPAPLAPDTPLERVASFAVEEEFARRVDDVIRRRTRLWLEPDRGRVAASRVAAAMAVPLGWSAERTRAEFQSYDATLWEEESLMQRSREER
jgi:glycerol-3-phosphate dehydrogenase